MADTKISALTASTTPLAGTEVLPIVQSGTTKQVSVANLTAGRAISAASVTASTGNFVVGTSGQGIDFSATPGAGTSELLADYEEGTFTPVIADAATGGNVAAAATTSGIYTKVGNVVTVHFQASSINTAGMTAGNILYFRGLPFTSNAAQVANGVTDMRNTTFTDYPTVFLGTSSAAAMLFMHASGAGVSQVLVAAVTGSSLFFITLIYTV